MAKPGQALEAQKQLIEAAQSGSMNAFEKLIMSVERQMLALAAGLASFPDEADDIYQDAVINAYNALPKFRVESQFSTWLYRIFVNTALSHKRRLSHQLSRHIQPEKDDRHEYYLCPERETQNLQLSRAISRALDSLSEQERIAFVLCHQQELSISDAANVMTCSEGSVKSYLFRARDKLRTLLNDYQPKDNRQHA